MYTYLDNRTTDNANFTHGYLEVQGGRFMYLDKHVITVIVYWGITYRYINQNEEYDPIQS